MKKIVSVLIALACIAALSAQMPPAGALPPGAIAGGMPKATDTSAIKRKYLDLAYATASKTQTLDIYLPEQGNGPFPVIVSIHGGGFAFGDNRGAELAAALAGLERGYAVVGVNYRLSGEAIFPAPIQDVKAAIRFLRANATAYKLDPARFATWGSSAGGNLSALAGTSGGVFELSDPGSINADQSDRLQAVVDWYGPVNFLTMDAQFAASGTKGQTHGTADSFESKEMGALITSIPEKVALANPETWIDAKDPPFFIQHGTADPNIPLQQSVDFANRLAKEIGVENVSFEAILGAVHGGAQFETEANLAKVFSFLDRYLK